MNFERDPLSFLELPNETGTPERNLLMAILERAILDYVGNDSREVEEADFWLFSDLLEPKYEEFSFPWVCQELDLDYSKIALKIKEMPKRGSNRIAPWHFTKHLAKAS